MSTSLPSLSELPPLIPIATTFPFLSAGRTKGYEMVKTGEFPLPIVQVGARARVRRADLARYLGMDIDGKAASQPAGDAE